MGKRCQKNLHVGVVKMDEKLDYMLYCSARMIANIADIKSGNFSDKGKGEKLDEIEFYLAEVDNLLGKIK